MSKEPLMDDKEVKTYDDDDDDDTNDKKIQGILENHLNRKSEDKLEHLQLKTIPINNNNNNNTDGNTEPVRLIAFVNDKSGSRKGSDLKRILSTELGENNVYDLSKGGPTPGLQENSHRKNVRVIACGGDGTFNWVLSTVRRMNLDFPVAFIPNGTGNDTSRQFGWGHKYPGNKGIIKNVQLMKTQPIVEFDRWIINVQHNSRIPDNITSNFPPSFMDDEEQGNGNYIAEFNNYLSFGVDAQITHQYHHHRETYPKCYCSRWCNMIWMGFWGTVNMGLCQSKPVPVRVEVPNPDDPNKWEELEIPKGIHAVVLLNLNTYAGGRPIWGKKLKKVKKSDMLERNKALTPAERNLSPTAYNSLDELEYDTDGLFMSPPSVSDGLLEVIGITSSFHLSRMVLMPQCNRGIRIAQVKEIKITCLDNVHVQADGEPWKDIQSTYHVKALPKSLVVQNS